MDPQHTVAITCSGVAKSYGALFHRTSNPDRLSETENRGIDDAVDHSGLGITRMFVGYCLRLNHDYTDQQGAK